MKFTSISFQSTHPKRDETKYRYLDENSIQEIAERLGISRRTVYNIMPRAYYYVAEWSHNVVFIVKKTYSFHLKTENLYNKLS